MKTTLITGAAGFVGMHCAQRLLERGDAVIGVDNLNDYYSPQLKRDRLARLATKPGFRFTALDIADAPAVEALFRREHIDRVLHLAAQAGVRYSIDHPLEYGRSNLMGFLHVLEGCRHAHVEHLVYASSSSVYGRNAKLPFSEHDRADEPVSLYAATKRSNELMAQAYSDLFGLPASGLRLFTVYGPWGRPDMAYYSFTAAVLEDRPIEVYDAARMSRDFTYIDDIVGGVLGVLDAPPVRGTDGTAPHRLFNLGNHEPQPLAALIECIERATGRRAQVVHRPMPGGDVPATFADITRAAQTVGFAPRTSLAEGIERFVAWYRDYHAEAE